MFNRALTTFAVLAAACAAASMPVSDSGAVARGAEVPATVSVCTAQGCVTIPVVNDSCVSFTGGLSFLASQVISAVIPGGFVCTFVANTKCESQGEYAVLTAGRWNFSSVPGPSRHSINFNKRAESFLCNSV